MISAQELRMGNWVYSHHSKWKIAGIRKTSVLVHNGDDYSYFVYRNLDGIPLSADLAEEIGFKINGGMRILYLDDIGFALNYYTTVDTTSIICNEGENEYDIDFKYLHQLQNLYYSLTGIELKCEL